MTKRAIPQTPTDVSPAVKTSLDAMKENIETITGARGGKLSHVKSNATLAEVITALNIVIDRIQE